MSEAGEFALDTAVSSRLVLGGESHDQLPQPCTCWWSAAPMRLGWLGPGTMISRSLERPERTASCARDARKR